MNFIFDLFGEPTAISSLLYIFLASCCGILLGKIKLLNVKLGIAGVLFCGIAFTHFGAKIDVSILNFIRDFGLILFVYSIGMDMGPRFITSFKKDGLTLNILAICIVLGGFLIALILYHSTNLPTSVILGIMCGAVTNTPGLGAAQQVLQEQGLNTTDSSMGYAIAYPFGVLGVILVMLLIRLIFRINISKEETSYNESLGGQGAKLESVEITVTNPNLFGKTISYITQVIDTELAVSRIYRNQEYILAKENEIICKGDVIYGVSTEKCIENLRLKMGSVVIKERKNVVGQLGICDVLITNRKIAGKTIEQVGIYRRYPANITRIYRSGIEYLPTKKSTLELGDTVKVVGETEHLDDVKKELGNSEKELAIPNIIPIFLGMFLGIIIGCIPISIPGMPVPAKLGLAGGPLIVAILLGYKGRIGKMSLYMTTGANLMLKELGIVLFLASVGLLAGENFIKTLIHGGWQWMIYGSIITFVPILIIGIIARIMKINYLKICGCISGAMTDPPALEFANGIAPTPAQSTAYAMVYPLTMFLRVILAQLFILLSL